MMDPFLFDIIADNVRTQAPTDARPKAIHVAGDLSEQQVQTILQAVHASPEATITRHEILDTSAEHYDAIIDLSLERHIDPTETLSGYAVSLRPNGLLVVAAQNRTWAQRPGSRMPRVSIQQVDKLLAAAQMSPVFRDPVGKLLGLQLIAHKKGALTRGVNTAIMLCGKHLPSSKFYSPELLFIYRNNFSPHKYISELSVKRRVKRVKERATYKIRNHKVNDYIVMTERKYQEASRYLRDALFITRRRFIKSKLEPIPILPPSKKTRVAVAMTWLEMGGVERVMLNLLSDLDKDKFEILLLTTLKSRNPWHEKFEQCADKIIHVPELIGEEYSERYKSLYISEYLIRSRVDALLITNSAATYRALRRLHRRAPRVRAYDLLHTHGTPLDKDAYLRISMPVDRYITKRIVIDEYLKIYYCNKYPVKPDKVLVIYNGLDSTVQSHVPNTSLGAKIIKKGPGEHAIVYLGRLESDKSPMRLVHIAAEIKRLLPNHSAYIAVCGDGVLRHDMEREATKLGVLDTHIRFMGYVDQTLDAVAAGSYTILTSDSEGIPMSILESMHSGIPAIAPSVGGIPEMIDHARDGYLVDIAGKAEDQKIAAFAEACVEAIRLSTDDYARMKTAAVEKVARKFSHMTDEYERLLLGDLD